MQNLRLVSILLPLVLGSALIAYGCVCFFFPVLNPSFISNPNDNAENPPGFLLFTSENIAPSAQSSMHFMIDNVNCGVGWADVSIDANFYRSMSSDENGTAYFVLQAFGNVANASVTINSQRPEDFGKTPRVILHERSSTSYLLAEIPRSKISGSIGVKIRFLWQQVFWRRSFYEFSLVVPFQFSFHESVYDVELPSGALNSNGILSPDITDKTLLSIARPEGATISNAMPNLDTMTFATGKVWYFWDIAKRSDPHNYTSTAVTVDIDLDNLKREYYDASAYFNLLLGIGIPLVISSFVGLAGLAYAERRSQENQPDEENAVSGDTESGMKKARHAIATILVLLLLLMTIALGIVRPLIGQLLASIAIMGWMVIVTLIFFFAHDFDDEEAATDNESWIWSNCDHGFFLFQYEQLNEEIRTRDNLTIIAGSIMVTASLLLLGGLMKPEAEAAPLTFASKVLVVTAALAAFSIWFLCFNLTSNKLDRLEYQRLRKMEGARKFRLHLYMWTKTRNRFWWNLGRYPVWLYMFYTLSVIGFIILLI